MIRVLGFDSVQGLGFFLFTTVSRPALRPTELPIQFVPGYNALGIKRSERETEHLPTSIAEVKECVELYLHSPIRLHAQLIAQGQPLFLPYTLLYYRSVAINLLQSNSRNGSFSAGLSYSSVNRRKINSQRLIYSTCLQNSLIEAPYQVPKSAFVCMRARARVCKVFSQVVPRFCLLWAIIT